MTTRTIAAPRRRGVRLDDVVGALTSAADLHPAKKKGNSWSS